MRLRLNELAHDLTSIRRDLFLLLGTIRAERPIDARSMWLTWRDEYPVDQMDIHAMKLIPRALDRVREIRIEEPEMPRFEGIERYFWAWTSANADGAEKASRLLATHGIHPIAVKGLAMRAYALVTPRLRPMVDADLVVRAGTTAIHVLKAAGFEQKAVTGHATILTKDRCEIDLHHQSPVALWDPWFSVFDYVAQETSLPYCVINKTGCFITTILHGLTQGGGATWVLDADDLIRSGEIDWSHVVKYAIDRALVLVFGHALCQLRGVPQNVRSELARAPASVVELIELRNMTTPGDGHGGVTRLVRDLRAKSPTVDRQGLREIEDRISTPEWLMEKLGES